MSSCYFCRKGAEPDYKDIEALNNFVSERAKIIGRSRTGLCRKHQSRLAKEVKKARHLALLPFVVKV
jgi:small subunit ribosomal protein S18